MVIRVNIIVHNTNYEIELVDKSLFGVIETMKRKLVTFNQVAIPSNKNFRKFGKITFRLEEDRQYYCHSIREKTYRFPISTVKDVIMLLKQRGVAKEEIAVFYDRAYKSEKLSTPIKKEFIPRDYQKKYIAALTNKDAKAVSLVDLFTGYGKTFISIYAISKINYRLVVLVIPRYIEKWVGDLMKYFDIQSADEINIIQGSDSLIDAMKDKNYKYKFTICSVRTMMNYIDAYEHEKDFPYPVTPNKLLRHLKAGTLLNDETHQEFHAVFKITTYLDPMRFNAMTATLKTKNQYLSRMYDVVFPPETRISNLVEYTRYITVYAIGYRINSLKGLQYRRLQGYNHILLEQSIVKNNLLLNSYVSMVDYILKDGFSSRKVKGDKCVIFASSIIMCTILTNWLSKLNPKLNIARYVENDKLDNVMNPDIDVTVTTVQGAGTAFDIPNLITVIQTVSISSLSANKQTFGRLRDLPGKEMRFYYVYCKDINEQINHHRDRINVLGPLAKFYNREDYHEVLRAK